MLLGFESPVADWSSPTGTLSQSSTHSQGSASLAVRNSGWTEISSVALSSLGTVGGILNYDIRVPASVSWGETRAQINIPSKGISWQDIGSVSLVGMAAGSFKTASVQIREPRADPREFGGEQPQCFPAFSRGLDGLLQQCAKEGTRDSTSDESRVFFERSSCHRSASAYPRVSSLPFQLSPCNRPDRNRLWPVNYRRRTPPYPRGVRCRRVRLPTRNRRCNHRQT